MITIIKKRPPRPGNMEVLDAGDGFVKDCVTPGNILSCSTQLPRRALIIIKGEAVVTRARTSCSKANDAVFIPAKTKHRIQNDTNDMMKSIEVQTGDNLDENDIIRYEDSYGRAGK
ncbi:MAG: hypothetical protein ACLSE6_05560 [Alphaproteobacteria bacterium]